MLIDEPCLDGDVADGKSDPPAYNPLGQISVCSILEGRLASMTTNMSLYRLDFLEKFLTHWLYWAGKQGRTASGR